MSTEVVSGAGALGSSFGQPHPAAQSLRDCSNQGARLQYASPAKPTTTGKLVLVPHQVFRQQRAQQERSRQATKVMDTLWESEAMINGIEQSALPLVARDKVCCPEVGEAVYQDLLRNLELWKQQKAAAEAQLRSLGLQPSTCECVVCGSLLAFVWDVPWPGLDWPAFPCSLYPVCKARALHAGHLRSKRAAKSCGFGVSSHAGPPSPPKGNPVMAPNTNEVRC